MAPWLKLLLWAAVLLLPGGVLLSPLLLAAHRGDLLGRGGGDADAEEAVASPVTTRS